MITVCTYLDVITACGTVVAAISIISAFMLYRIQKRDEYLSKVRTALQRLSNDMDELDSLLNFELAYELSSALIYSKSAEYCLKKIFDFCNSSISTKQNQNQDQVKKAIRKMLGVFGVSFQDTIANRYTSLISEIKQSSTIFYPDYKGLFRFSKACTTLMRNVFMNYKRLLLDEDILTEIIVNNLMDRSELWESFDDFQKDFLDHLISLLEIGRIEHSQKDVDCLNALVEIVYSCHIELSSKEWRKLARKNRKVTMQPYENITTVTGDFREAEKGFCSIMSHDAITRYASLVQTIEITNKESK